MASHAATATDLHHHDEEHPPEVIWSSKTPINLMGMLFFIGSEIALFGSFFMSYFFLRIAGEADYSSWAAQVGEILAMARSSKLSSAACCRAWRTSRRLIRACLRGCGCRWIRARAA